MKWASIFGDLKINKTQYYCYVNNHPVTNNPIYVGTRLAAVGNGLHNILKNQLINPGNYTKDGILARLMYCIFAERADPGRVIKAMRKLPQVIRKGEETQKRRAIG